MSTNEMTAAEVSAFDQGYQHGSRPPSIEATAALADVPADIRDLILPPGVDFKTGEECEAFRWGQDCGRRSLADPDGVAAEEFCRQINGGAETTDIEAEMAETDIDTAPESIPDAYRSMGEIYVELAGSYQQLAAISDSLHQDDLADESRAGLTEQLCVILARQNILRAAEARLLELT